MNVISYATVYTEGLKDPEVSAAFDRELERLRSSGPIECPHIIDGERLATGARIEREDPTHPDRVAAVTFEAGEEIVEKAVAAAKRAAPEWGLAPLETRCQAMLAATKRLADSRVELAALMAHEIGKTRADTLA